MTHFSAGNPANTSGAVLRTNLYFNGGKPIPVDPDRVLNRTDDPRAIVADPGLPPDLSSIVPPTWRDDAGHFADGSRTIEEARGAWSSVTAHRGRIRRSWTRPTPGRCPRRTS